MEKNSENNNEKNRGDISISVHIHVFVHSTVSKAIRPTLQLTGGVRPTRTFRGFLVGVGRPTAATALVAQFAVFEIMVQPTLNKHPRP